MLYIWLLFRFVISYVNVEKSKIKEDLYKSSNKNSLKTTMDESLKVSSMSIMRMEPLMKVDGPVASIKHKKGDQSRMKGRH